MGVANPENCSEVSWKKVGSHQSRALHLSATISFRACHHVPCFSLDVVPPLEDMTTYLQQLKQRPIATSSTPQPAKHVDSSLLELDLPAERQDSGRLLVCENKRPAKVLPVTATNPKSSEVARGKSGAVKDAAASFGGMRKGFLFGSGPSNKSACREKECAVKRNGDSARLPERGLSDASATPPDMTFLRAGPSNGKGAENSLRMDEVQEEMKKCRPLLASQGLSTVLSMHHFDDE